MKLALTLRALLPAAVADQLLAWAGVIRETWGAEHDDDGRHGDVTADQVLLRARIDRPGAPAASAEARLYLKGSLLVAQFTDGATVRYKYLDLSGTGVTWTHTTSPP